ncbi:MAG: hypothetical protein J0J06_09780 [Sphingomonas sp.]|uniref:hypothetical protein n=1 Tax=Sphingomonas sp. TaxID=28214 RepID=UPI001AD3F8F5|nr:hypothetical protein [Sphingomonas sp.]MBN8815724.1 hypothetical protein [Sphingomonas sp.]
MDLIDRYLAAIRWNLPREANADDVIAELRDVIASQIEDREDALGRPLGEKEVSAILRDFGHPLAVAARYGAQQSLIGPDLFPFYWFVLKVVLAIVLAVGVLSNLADVVFGGKSLAHALAGATGGLWWSLLGNAALVTLGFAVLERTGWLNAYLQKWKPEELPNLADLKVKPQSAWNSAFEVAAGIVIILWWVGMIHVPLAWTDEKGLTLTPAPVWATLWTPMLALMIAHLIYNVVRWVRPRWKATRALLGVGTTAGALALLVVIYRAGRWITASSATMPADRVADIDRSINLSIHYAIIGVGLIWVFQCGQELWRLYMVRR